MAKKRTLVKHQKKFSRKIVLSCFLALFAVIVVLISYLQMANFKHTDVRGRVDAADYFEIFDFYAVGNFSSTKQYVVIKYVGFYLKAKGGDANNIYVDMEGRDILNSQPFEIPTLPMGNSTFVEMSLSWGYRSKLTNGVYPVKVKVICDEAYGWITVNLNETQIYEGSIPLFP
jgi:hypothetical protein